MPMKYPLNTKVEVVYLRVVQKLERFEIQKHTGVSPGAQKQWERDPKVLKGVRQLEKNGATDQDGPALTFLINMHQRMEKLEEAAGVRLPGRLIKRPKKLTTRAIEHLGKRLMFIQAALEKMEAKEVIQRLEPLAEREGLLSYPKPRKKRAS